MTAPAVLDKPDVSTGNTDAPRMAHIIDQREKDAISESLVMGTELTALCGYKFISTRSPEGLPVCAECKQIAEHILG